MQWGIGMFLIAVPIDILNHRINGLDITSWSPSHALLYLGTAVMLAGAIRGWWLYAAPGRVRDLVSLGLWLFFVENVALPQPAPGVRRPVAEGLQRGQHDRRAAAAGLRRLPGASRRRCSCCPCRPGCTRPG